ncbi:hypothetical protein NDU88_007770 [Pleurodeles waltl]|uniref:Uncharacterized protein n=1 Tax=Pleurodeles waltl TaxID=8319 RepID=A0AAV7P337_PLEWA|nr:hypothetical protein NDU88_007770 [Pleurodeles waltl]
MLPTANENSTMQKRKPDRRTMDAKEMTKERHGKLGCKQLELVALGKRRSGKTQCSAESNASSADGVQKQDLEA